MADIFISYAREDRALADNIAAAMKESGLSVFWDRTIPPGKTWREVIGAVLEAARHVIVVWSGNSVNSRWVLEEADHAAQRNVIIPVLGEDVKPPLGFGAFQCADLSQWKGDMAAGEFRALLEVFPSGRVAHQLEESMPQAPNATPEADVVDNAKPGGLNTELGAHEHFDQPGAAVSAETWARESAKEESVPPSVSPTLKKSPVQSWNAFADAPAFSRSPDDTADKALFVRIPKLAFAPFFVLILYWVIGGLLQVDQAMAASFATKVPFLVWDWSAWGIFAHWKHPPVLELVLLTILTITVVIRRASIAIIPAAGACLHLVLLIATYAVFGFQEDHLFADLSIANMTIGLSLVAVAANLWAFRILRAGR